MKKHFGKIFMVAIILIFLTSLEIQNTYVSVLGLIVTLASVITYALKK